MDKGKLRQEMQQFLKTTHSDKRLQEIAAIHNRLTEHPLWEKARTIGMTVSTGNEIDTHALIHKAWEEGKSVAVPKCDPKEKRLIFRALSDFNQLESVYYGLKEPIPALTRLVNGSEIDLLIVPGLCFDSRGFRIGFGGGYYDRYLEHYHGLKLSLAFNEQVISTVPNETHDRPVDYIVTPSLLIQCHLDS